MERELATVETNAVGMTRMVGAAFHYFEVHPGQKGQIAVISSIAGTKGLGAAPAYSATKRYVNHYLECLTQLCHIRRLRHISIPARRRQGGTTDSKKTRAAARHHHY